MLTQREIFDTYIPLPGGGHIDGASPQMASRIDPEVEEMMRFFSGEDPEQPPQPASPPKPQPTPQPPSQVISQPSQSWARQMLQRVTDSLFRLVGTEDKGSAASAGGNVSLTAPDQYRVGERV